MTINNAVNKTITSKSFLPPSLRNSCYKYVSGIYLEL